MKNEVNCGKQNPLEDLNPPSRDPGSAPDILLQSKFSKVQNHTKAHLKHLASRIQKVAFHYTP